MEYMPIEIRPCIRDDRYLIGSDGSVYSTNTMRYIKQTDDKNGYQQIALGRRRTAKVHQIVLEAFCKEERDNRVVRHLDGNPKNNRVENLKWGTRKENHHDMIGHGRIAGGLPGEQNHKAIKTNADVLEMRRLRRYGMRNKDIARLFGVSASYASTICVGKTAWKHVAPSGVKPWSR
jgi:hypothetical protein